MILPLVSVIFATTTWYLLSMAELTRAIWSRYPPWLDEWVSCPACSGAWWTGGWALLLAHDWGWDWFGLRELGAIFPFSVLWGCYWVPLAAWLLDKSLRTRGEG